MVHATRQIAASCLLIATFAASACRQTPTYTLKITFGGAVAFAPDKMNQHFWALLPAGDEPGQEDLTSLLSTAFGYADQRLYINLHQPVIRIARKYLDGNECEYRDIPVIFSLSSAKALAPVEDSNDRVGHQISFEEPFDGDGVTPHDLKYIPYIGGQMKPCDTRQKLNGTYTSPIPQNDNLRARLLLTTGSLKATSLLPQSVKFGYYTGHDDADFTTVDPDIKKLAQAAEAQLIFHQAPLHLVLTTFKRNVPEQDVQRFALHPVDDEVDIAILNLPADDLLQRDDAGRHDMNHQISDHFLLYYLLRCRQ